MEGGPPDLPTGQEGLRALFDHIGGVEQRWTGDDVVAEGDRVVDGRVARILPPAPRRPSLP